MRPILSDVYSTRTDLYIYYKKGYTIVLHQYLLPYLRVMHRHGMFETGYGDQDRCEYLSVSQ
jgi:hypothetical protein